jgi:ABC-type nitrate/sulfonate/bicarbonate transport system substrate-binding protein
MWRRLAHLCLPVVALVLVGCQPSPTSSGTPSSISATAPAGAVASGVPTVTDGAPLTLIRVVVPQGATFDVALPVFVAEQEGYFARYGVQIETQEAKGGADTVQAVAAGDDDAALGSGPLAVFSAYALGARLVIISNEIYGSPDLVFFAPAGSSISSARDFPGHRIGYSEPGSSSHFALLAVQEQLREQGLGDFDMVPVGGVSQGLAAVQAGRIDASWGGAPTAAAEAARSNVKVVARGADVPTLRNLSMRVDFMNADFAAEHPKAVRALLAALQQADAFIFDPGTRARAMTIWKQRTSLKQSPADLQAAYDFFSQSAVAIGPMKGADVVNRMAGQVNVLKTPLTQQELDEVITTRYLPSS